MNLAEAFLATAPGRAAIGDLGRSLGGGSLVITPRFADSRHVVVLLLDTTGEPCLVGKIVRAGHERSTLDHEDTILKALAGAGVDRAGVPRSLAFTQVHGHWLLLQTAVAGRAVTHLDARRRPTYWWGLVQAWLDGLPQGPAGEPEAWAEAYLGAALGLARGALRPSAHEALAFDATWHHLLTWAGAGHPSVLQHGDLSHPNLLSPGSGRIGVVDWETGHEHGALGADAAVFLTFLSFAVAGVHGVEAEALEYSRSMLDDTGTGRLMLTDYLARHGVEKRWVDHVLLAAWARTALEVFPRLVSNEGSGSNVDSGSNVGSGSTGGSDLVSLAAQERAAALFRASRPTRLWQLTLDHLGHSGS